jgi:hypothetical protein
MVLLGLNLPAGDSDRMLNLEDLIPALAGDSAVGDEGRMDFRITGGGDMACTGEVGRMVGAGVALMVGAGPAPLIDPRIVYLPASFLEARGRDRWKLLWEASESLSYVGAGVIVFLGADDATLCGRGADAFLAATAAGMCLFWSAPLGGFASTGGLLKRDAANPAGCRVDSFPPRIDFRICGSGEEMAPIPAVSRMLFFMRGSLDAALLTTGPSRIDFLIGGGASSIGAGVTAVFFRADLRGCAAGLGVFATGSTLALRADMGAGSDGCTFVRTVRSVGLGFLISGTTSCFRAAFTSLQCCCEAVQSFEEPAAWPRLVSSLCS